MGFSDKKAVLKKIMIGFLILWPFLSVIILLAVHGKTMSDCKPVWGDEQWWWSQAGAVAKYGKPLGYWGYNGGTAKIGTFAAWGPAAVLPFGLFGKMFGWNCDSYVAANVFFMCAAEIFFLLLTRAKRKDVMCLCLVNFCMILRSYFAVTAMMECIRCSLGIAAVALLIFIDRQDRFLVKYFVVPFYLFYLTQAYLIMGIFFFFYFSIILKRTGFKWQKKVWISFGCMGSVVLFSKWFLGYFTSPYVENRKQTFMEKVVANIKGIVELFYHENQFFCVFFLGYLTLMLVLFFFILFKRKELEEADQKLFAAAFVILAAFLGGHIIFYNTTAWTFIRGLSIGLTISLFLLCLTKSKAAVGVFIVCSILSIPTYRNIEQTFFQESRFRSEEWDTMVADYTKQLEQVLEVKEDANTPWENTVATYFMQGSDVFVFTLPRGFAVNSMMNQTVNRKAKYAMMGKWNDDTAYQSKLEELQSAGFVKAFDDDKITVLRNTEYN